MNEPALDVRAVERTLRPFVGKRVGAADVDDVVQEVLLRAHRGVGALADRERLGPWLYKVARSAIADHLRMRARHPLAGGDPAEPALEGRPEAEPDAGDVKERLASVMAVFVSFLPSPYREAITLTELEGLTQREAAEQLEVALPTLKSRVLRGRARLRRIIEGVCEVALDARGAVVSCEPRPAGEIRLPDDCCGEAPGCSP